MNLTQSQSLARDLEGNSLLVSAAAGSGKTSVLTERVIRKLTDKNSGCDADRLVILTYTNAAAAEMRSRISARLRTIVSENPQDEFVRRQLMLLPAAKICTIHSACLDIIRSNFQLCDIDPTFSIAEETKLALMRSQMLEDFTEQLYERAQSAADILHVIEYFTKGKNDNLLMKSIDSSAEFLEKQPYAKQYIEDAFSVSEISKIDMLKKVVADELCDIIAKYENLIQCCISIPRLVDFYGVECDFVKLLQKYMSEGKFDTFYETIKDYKFKNHPSKKDEDPDMWEMCSESRKSLKKSVEFIKNELVYQRESEAIKDLKAQTRVLKTFMELCNEFNESLFMLRKKQRLISFDEVEKYALSLLIEDIKDGEITKTELAKELSENIDEIIVDEFQDCNKTQDLIFKALSKDGKNIFMVGDVKQSIYRFRNARPDIFLEKQKNSEIITENCTLTKPSRIDLSTNFRSHKNIIDFVNAVFDPLMTKQSGGIDYTDGHRLEVNTEAAEHNLSEAHIYFLASGVDDNSPVDSLSKTQAEAEFVASKIKDLIQNKTIFDTKTRKERKVKPSDIAILMRAPKTIGKPFEDALLNADIPYINNNPQGSYLESREIQAVLSFLQAIDNPYDDVPLVSLMYSDFYGFTPDMLGAIRGANKKVLFYDAVKEYAKTDSKTADFVKTLEHMRALCQTTDVYGIISAIYEKTGILLRLSLKSGSQEARANLNLLLEYAADFESTRYRGLFAFISYIVKLIEKKEKNSVPAARLKKSGECVSILSIHRSKGLEYPIVFFVGTASNFKPSDSFEIMANEKYRVGGYVRDFENHRDFSSFTRNLIKKAERSEEINEYIRLLYVALTRPVSSVYITASMSVSNIEDAARCAFMAKGYPDKSDLMQKPTFIKWMLLSLINSKQAAKICAFAGVPTDLCIKETNFEIFLQNVTEQKAVKVEKQTESACLGIDKQTVKKLITRKYLYEQDTLLPAKLSVSEIKKINQDSLSMKTSFKSPDFANLKSGIEKGNATHTFLQFCDFNKITDDESFEKEKERLQLSEFISKSDAELVSKQKVLSFIGSDIMQKLLKENECFKEERFLFTMKASELLDTDSDEQIIVQGIVDCLFVNDNKAVILDYKTDTVKDAKTLIDRYKSQLDMYAAATERIKGYEVLAKYIYSFCLEQFIQV